MSKRQSDICRATDITTPSIPLFYDPDQSERRCTLVPQRWVKGKEGRKYWVSVQSPGWTIPYVIALRMSELMEKHGVVATGSIITNFSPKWELMIRSGIDLEFRYPRNGSVLMV